MTIGRIVTLINNATEFHLGVLTIFHSIYELTVNVILK
jgi:hypothetical protein